jgi:ABC-type phosphate/phosphonate transport system substrate-binding protein
MAELAIPAKIEPDAYYDVKLSTTVVIGATHHSPHHRVIIKGDMWPKFKDAITSAMKLAPGDETRL